jgi:HlyD family secretion protein
MLLGSGCGMKTQEQAKQPVPNVKVAAVRSGEIAMQVPVVGTVTPSETSDVAAGVAGLVVEYPVDEGQFIHRGETLAQLETTGLKIQIEKATALMQQQEEMYRELLKGYRPEEVASAKAGMLAAAADFDVATARYARLERGQKRTVSAVTAEQFEEARFELERARQAHAASKADFEMKSAGYRVEQIAAAKAAMQAQLQEVRHLEDDLKKHSVPAPFDGFVVAKKTDVGEWVNLGGMVATMVGLDEVEVRVNVNESQIDQVRVGRTVDVHVDALGGRSMEGRVKFVVPKSEWKQGSRSFPVVVRMKNEISDGVPLLKEGMVARITFRGLPRRGLLAHKDAIVRSAGLSTVFVVEGDRTVRAVNVVEGLSEGEFIEVEGDLKAGDLLVTEGVERLRPYDQVTVIDAPTAGGETVPTARTAVTVDDSEAKGTGGD